MGAAHLVRGRVVRSTIIEQEHHSSEQQFQVPEKDQQEGVVAFAIQEAPLYHRNRALIQVNCGCCGHQDVVTVGFREPTGQVQQRRVGFLKDGEQRITDIGTR